MGLLPVFPVPLYVLLVDQPHETGLLLVNSLVLHHSGRLADAALLEAIGAGAVAVAMEYLLV